MDEVQLVQSGMNVVITWSQPGSNGGTINDYAIKLLNRTSNQFVESTVLCDGSNVNVKTCTVPISSFISSFGYSAGQSIKVIA